LKARGLTRSRRHFPRDFLGMAANYSADTGLARCSADALVHLCRRLGVIGRLDLQAFFKRLLEAEMRDNAVRAVRP
jgi:hypothetical protein